MTATRVTIIDDDGEALGLFREILEDEYAVETFAGALPGIERLIESAPDVVIVDLRLEEQRHELSGLEILDAIRASEALHDVPIILCTAHVKTLRFAWQDIAELGNVHQLEKPFDLTALERVLATALRRPQAFERGTDPATSAIDLHEG